MNMNISCRIANANTQCGRITNPPEREELFSNNKINPVGKDGVPEYTQGFIIPTTLEQDKIMRASALSEINKDYNLILSNCAQTVQNALCSVGLSPGNGIVPRYQVYPSIVVKNKGEIFLYYDTRNKQYSRGAK